LSNRKLTHAVKSSGWRGNFKWPGEDWKNSTNADIRQIRKRNNRGKFRIAQRYRERMKEQRGRGEGGREREGGRVKVREREMRSNQSKFRGDGDTE